ncbi:tripartite motif-containing protein 16-like [Solea solea]|uniref:tripartite motif-containing protein 16-like n=1 Tax=Solea solea TaxID=90069 RepID=UPI00272B7227|nr:tripartite motif-containing protein 16-like [Solea solea]
MPRKRAVGRKRRNQARADETGNEDALLATGMNSNKAAALPEMAQKGVQLRSENFSCPICLELLKNPATTPCGHNFCLDCIKTYWDGRTISSCPQCRKTFTQRPELMKNTMLTDLVEELKKTEVHAAPVCDLYVGDEDVACDVCTGRWKRRAVKSCLVCLASFCEEHLQPHHQSPALKKHKLAEPCENLQQNICPHHDEVMKMFCRTDQQCICYHCSLEEHKDHDMVSAAAARTHKQRELDLSLQKRLQDIKEHEKVLDQEVKNVNLSADEAVEDSERTFTELTKLLQIRSSEVTQQIRYKQRIEVRLIKDNQRKLQRETWKLKNMQRDLEQHLLNEDHTQFLLGVLHAFPPAALSPSVNPPTINVQAHGYFEDVTAAVAKVRGQLQDVLTETPVDVVMPQPEPKSRAEFLTHSRKLTLDPNTAHEFLILSKRNRKVTLVRERQAPPPHPLRFSLSWQVLSKESLSGRCYWEVEKKAELVDIAVAYSDVTGSHLNFGNNDRSWSLTCFEHSYVFSHDHHKDQVGLGSTSRVGVFLDHVEGFLSFYDVSDTMTLIHRVHTTFTEPLYAGLGFPLMCPGSTAEFI